MENKGQVRLLKNQDIDYGKWDRCVNRFSFGKLYARSWYLDLVAEGWNALVFGDYEFVMPLPVRAKYGITYVYQPSYSQQLGIFPAPPLEIQKQFAVKLKKSFRLVNYQLNVSNHDSAFSEFNISNKINYTLNLTPSFYEVSVNFSNHAFRYMKVAGKKGVRVTKGLSSSDYLQAKKEATKIFIGEKIYTLLNRLMANTITSGKGIVYAAWSPENKLCAAAFVIIDDRRIYYLNAFSNDDGRENRAMYAIVEEIIGEFAGSGYTLDFEGSVIEGIARFYKGFGATAANYSYIYSNRLPVIRKFMNQEL